MTSTTQIIHSILRQYQQGLAGSIAAHNGLVGEFFAESESKQGARLLCQSRSVYFLLRYAEIFSTPEILAQAKKLYLTAREHYHLESQWRMYPSSDAPLDLYGYASLSYTECYLFQATQDKVIGDYARQSLHHLSEVVLHDNFFPDHCVYAQAVSQNPLMHLFESFVVGFDILQKDFCRSTAQHLLKLVKQHFYIESAGLVQENLSDNHQSDWYEPGHAYEWASLLMMAEAVQVLTADTLPQELIHAAEQYCVGDDKLVPSKVDSLTKQVDETFRIWPQLERIRAHFLSRNQKCVDAALSSVFSVFFNEQYLHREYVGQAIDRDTIKTTTGYHIINGLVDYLLSANTSRD